MVVPYSIIERLFENVKDSGGLTDNRVMARKKSSNSSSRTPMTRTREPQLPTEQVATGTGMVDLELDRDNPRQLTVMLDGAPSSFLDLDDPTNVGFEYMEIMLAVLAELSPGPLNAVHLGAAGCTMARAIEALRPNSRQIGVDIDGPLLEYARQWFDLPRSPKLRLRTGDARAELAKMADASADVIIRDVFAGVTTPSHLTTTEFLAQVLRVLRPGGVYLVNCADRPPLAHARREVATGWAALGDYQGAQSDPGTGADLALISEPALLKGRRYGNLVLVITKPVPEHVAGARATEAAATVDLESAALGRRLRTLAVPAHIQSGRDARAFAGSAAVLRDEPASSEPA